MDNPLLLFRIGEYRYMRPAELPRNLGSVFSVNQARASGLNTHRLRANDLEMYFHGTRVVRSRFPAPSQLFEEAKVHELALIRALGSRLLETQFFSHRSAAMLWGAPVPHLSAPELHVGVVSSNTPPRVKGVIGHRFLAERAQLREAAGLSLLSPACTLATMGALPVADLVVLGDHLARRYRPGIGRKNVGKPPLATIAELEAVVNLGRWQGVERLRKALKFIREDSWSPQETLTRLTMLQGGLPEPQLNIDLFDRNGHFLACVDMAYPEYKVVVEYHGEQHELRYADDIERVERLRAAGWIVVQVTKELARRPRALMARIAKELRARGWDGRP